MSNYKNYYRDDDFDAAQTGNCTLLLQLGVSTFTYAVVMQNKLLAFAKNVDISEIDNPTAQHEILLANYEQRIVGLAQQGFTFVPMSLFNADYVADFARYLDVKPNEKVFSQPLDTENQVLYKVYENIALKAIEKFGAANMVFAAKGWIKSATANNPLNQQLYLNITTNNVELLNFKDSKLRFYNSFEFNVPDELVYFTLFVAEELKLQPNQIELIISGDLEMGDQNANKLAKFFDKLTLNDTPTIALPQQIASHTVLTLTALSLCGLSEAL